MAEIFLSYRREDSEAETRNIENFLTQAGHHVFMDQNIIQPGEHWPDKIKNALKAANIVVAVIGTQWLTCQDREGRRRIDGEEDWVRLELKSALQTDKKIIPVLVNDAKMFSPTSVPVDLKELSNRQCLSISRVNWIHDLQLLLNKLENIFPSQPPKKKPSVLLTSESPRRKELLKQIGWVEGVDYITMHASVNLSPDETPKPSLEWAQKITEETACAKINWVMDHNQSPEIAAKLGRDWNPVETIVVGVDTVVFCKDKILDRPLLKSLEFAGPKDIDDARERAKEMLLEQRGQQVNIITSIAVATANNFRNPTIKTVVTNAQLRPYTDEDIDNYIFYAEPFDMAGAFGIQEKGVSLFVGIQGSYTNIVGLPLQEFVSLLNESYGDMFELPSLKSTLGPNESVENETLSVVCVGDINYDYIYDKFPVGFFADIRSPGKKIMGSIHRAVGGTAVNFAKGSAKAGFAPCYVVGVIGGDALGQEIVRELHHLGFTPIYRSNPNEKTSIAVIFRDIAKEDTSITITDSYQSLPDFVVGLARDTIQQSDVFYCSGYCLADQNRRASAVKMLTIAKNARCLSVLDIVVGMNKEMTLDELTTILNDRKTYKLADVAASELPEIFAWFHLNVVGKTELDAWETHKEILIPRLRELFSVVMLRTSKYTDEIVITPDVVIGPVSLDYASLKAREKVGYGDFRTAEQVHSFLSPRIALASKSPQRFNLLGQIVASSKVEVVVSDCTEEKKAYEAPYDRVQRLALEKADAVFRAGQYHDDIELIIGADTEIIRQGESGEWQMIGHPHNVDEAIQDLTRLSGKSHFAITGMAVIGKDPRTGAIKKLTTYVETKVTFADLGQEQMRAYAETGEPIARAGAYAIQGLGAMFIKDLEGSYSNVVGLPLERLSEILAVEFHKPIWKFDKVSNWTFPDPIKGLH